MHILITGASGFIGGHLVKFWSGNHEMSLIVREGSGPHLEKEGEVIRGDLGDPGLYSRLPESVDAVVHLGFAQGSFPRDALEMFSVNCESTLRLAEYARQTGAKRFIFASTGNVYAQQGQESLHEDTPLRPKGFYGLTKALAERLLEPYARFFSISILRLFALYGPGQTNRMIPNIVGQIMRGVPTILNNEGEPRTNPIYISDVVEVFDRALVLGGVGAVNVAGPEVVSIKDIAEIAAGVLGAKPEFEHRSLPEHFNLVADRKKFEATFDLSDLVVPAEGIARVARWLKER